MEFHDFWWFLWFLRFPWFSGPRGGPGGGPKRGPPKCPPPIFGVHFPLKWPKYHWFYKQKWKGEIPAWVSWIPLFIFPYRTNGLLVILIKQRTNILRSYNNRGPPAGPGRGPAWGPSRGFRFSRFSQNFCISGIFKIFRDFAEFSEIFSFFLKLELPSPPMRKRWYS